MPNSRTIEIPEAVLLSAQTLDDLEDWLSTRDPEFVKQMRSIRKNEDLTREGTDLAEILKQWPIEP